MRDGVAMVVVNEHSCTQKKEVVGRRVKKREEVWTSEGRGYKEY